VPVRDLWQLRATRQMALGLVPLALIGIVVIVVLAVLGSGTASKLSDATGRATGVVQHIDSNGGKRQASIAWTDQSGNRHTSHVSYPAASHPASGDKVGLHYVPSDPAKVYSSGDVTYDRLNSQVAGVLYAGLIVVIAAITTGIRLWRRAGVGSRQASTVKLSRVRTRFGLIHRSWLVATRGNTERWVPVFWDPVLSRVRADTPLAVHGDLEGGGPIAVDIEDTRLWSSGRVRRTAPRGQQIANPGTYSKKEPSNSDEPVKQISLRRQAFGDAGLVIIAPILGILWAYINGLGPAGFGVATALLVGLLFWIPSCYGSDPSN
jgi:hypothetical protein